MKKASKEPKRTAKARKKKQSIFGQRQERKKDGREGGNGRGRF
jgi:hypothetical protein